MIAKQVLMKSVKSSDFGGLVRYLIGEQGKQERVGAVRVANCESSEAEIAILEVINTQAQNTRSRSDKTFHLIVSFAPGEQPDVALLREIEGRICEGIGFAGHQRISVVHHDTDILHMHIAINKIHPTRYTIKEPFNVFHTLGQLCGQLEDELGLQKTNHTASKSLGQNRADDIEHHAAVESLLGWIRRECGATIGTAQSWAELHRTLREHGLDMQSRGNGLVIVDKSGVSVKASCIQRDLSKRKLEAKLGAFEPADERQASTPSMASYDKEPMAPGFNTDGLYARYKEAQQTRSESRAVQWTHATERKKRLIEEAKRRAKFKRSAIKLMKGAGIMRKLLYGLASKALRDEIKAINKQYLQQRQEVFDKYRRRNWADWLRADAVAGNDEALTALRARGATHTGGGNSIAGKGRAESTAGLAKLDGVTKHGTVVYRAGATAFRDDGEKLQVSRGADAAGLLVALRLAVERYGDRISVQGTDVFKEQIAMAAASARLPISFDDAVLERRRCELMQPNPFTEQNHEQQRAKRKRIDRGGPAGGEFAASAGAAKPTRRGSRNAPAAAARANGKPNVGRPGREPPPASQNRLRGLRELGVVQLTGRSEVLLPGHVPGHLEQHGTQPDNGLRRHVAGSGLAASAAGAAAAKYVLEREQRRLTLFDIPKHAKYNFDNDVTAAFGGIRRVDGHALALVRGSDGIVVVPIDDTTARRLRRIAIGAELRVKPDGEITATKGRSR